MSINFNFRKKLKMAVWIAYIFCCSIGSLYAQSGMTAKGRITDAAGEPLPGAAVLVLGSTRGVTSDENGRFELTNVSVGTKFKITYLGMIDKNVTFEGKELEIVLEDNAALLGEVTVVAFGRQKKQSVVSSISTVKASDLRVPGSNLTSALAGRIPGLISYQTTGEPGADNADFFIRGVGTFGYKADPLILIDGFESTRDDLARLHPDDIESFSVMKDASATVMYGARSANGIISVTTKSGVEGDVRISVRADVNMATPTRSIDFLDGVRYMRLYNEAQITRNPLLGAYYDEQKIQSTIRGENPMIYPNVQWYDELFNKQTYNEKANINISGGGKVATYYIAGALDHETGLMKVDKRNNFNNNIDIMRTQIRSNVIFKLSSTTTLDTRVTGRFERYNGPYVNATDLFQSIMWSNPVDFPALYEPDEERKYAEHQLFGSMLVGNEGDAMFKVNPYARMVQGYEDRNETRLNVQATLLQDLGFITENLKLSLKIAADSWSEYTSRRYLMPYFYALESYNQVTEEFTLFPLNPTYGRPYLGDVYPGRDANGRYYYEGVLTWNKDLKDLHHLGLTVVGLAQENLLTGGSSTSIYETLPEKNLGVSGRFTYDFDSRYFADFSWGYNGSEKFTGSKQYGFFPALAGAWLVSNEKFFESLKDKITLLKLKASWGKGGNDAIAGRSGRFFFLSDIRLGGNNAVDGYRWGETFMNSYPGYVVSRYANPAITWETSTKYNAGMELSFLKDEAIKFQADVFKNYTDNIYMERQNFPSSAGLEAAISGNVGKMEANGVDLSLDGQWIFNRDTWIQGRANYTYATNKLVELDEKNYPDEYRKRKGHNWDQQWGLIAERLFVDEAEIANSPHQDFGPYMAGDIKYKDVNGDGVINENDQVPMGYPTKPEIQYGYGLSGGWKNWDLSFFFQGNARVSLFINPSDSPEGIAPFIAYRNALPLIADDYWSETNPDPHAFWPRLSTNVVANNTQRSSWWMRDASFMRLKTVELGYNIRNLKQFKLSNLRFYVTAENVFAITGFNLWDPEMGGDGLKYPPNRRFSVGLKFDFN
ncbi:SusC/RagA family TonB-linked outer membrane protein [Bacteroidia bacterium]|nr:SusC/RagA family TonB-linked outer membrane protein [Bacteroidia bacterium]